MTSNVDDLEERLRRRFIVNSHPLETVPDADTVRPRGNIPNTPLAASITSLILGIVFCFGVLTFFGAGFSQYWWSTFQLGFFVAAWAFFHWAEFAVTAGWNFEKCSVDSFLLDNGSMYHVANGTALTEYLLSLYFMPTMKAYPYLSAIGIAFVLFGQGLRSAAMIHASTNFSHSVAFKKRDTHKLVTDGVYGWFRHPSYAGFYYWALGTQMVLQNPISCVLYCVLLWRFFYYRTRAEEGALLRFFGRQYEEYCRSVRTWIPFVP